MLGIAGLVGATLILSALYLMMAIFAGSKLLYLHKVSPKLNTRKLFVMTCLLTCVLRFMSFGAMTALNYQKLDRDPFIVDDDTEGHISRTDEFFDKASLALFDFPDYSAVSAYGLLLVVWCEAYLQSRRHWLPANKFKQSWMLWYFVFNIVLYSMQIALYVLLFFPMIDEEVLSACIYLAMSAMNFLLPITWMITFWYLSFQFAGFPFSSQDAQERLSTLSRLTAVWSVTRFGFGILALTSVLQGWFTSAKEYHVVYSIFMIAVFVVIDILPIAYGLHTPVLMCLTEKRVLAREENVRMSEKTNKSRGSAGSGTSGGSGAAAARRNITPLKEASHLDIDPTTAPLLPPMTGDPDSRPSMASSYGPEEEDIPIAGYNGSSATNANAGSNAGWGGYVSYWTGGGGSQGGSL